MCVFFEDMSFYIYLKRLVFMYIPPEGVWAAVILLFWDFIKHTRECCLGILVHWSCWIFSTTSFPHHVKYLVSQLHFFLLLSCSYFFDKISVSINKYKHTHTHVFKKSMWCAIVSIFLVSCAREAQTGR